MKRSYHKTGRCKPHRWAAVKTPSGVALRKCVECYRIERAREKR